MYGGFTLLEIIITIIIFGIASSMLFVLFGNSITQSSAPIHRLSRSLELKQVAERITAHYKDGADDLNTLHTTIANAPANYGQNFTVTYNNFIKFINGNDTEISEEGGDPKDILKVTITHTLTSESITMMFVEE